MADDKMSKGKKKPLRGAAAYDREKLYKEVWTMPTENIGEKYGVSGSTIRKMCSRLNIPLPPISYWKRNPEQTGRKIRDAKGILNFLPTDDIVTIAKAANNIKVSEEVRHPVLLNHQKSIKKWAKYNTVDELAPRNKNTFDKSNAGEPALWGCVSDKVMPRVYLILDSLFSAFESVGCTVNADLSITIMNENVRFNITECKTEIPRTLTQEESEAIQNCLADGKENGIRTTDYVYNGQLWFAIEKDYFIKDIDNIKLENRFCEIFLLLYAKSERVRIQRESDEDSSREQIERKLIKKMFRDEHDDQIDMFRELENEAIDFERAERIRKYISAFDFKAISNEKKQLAEWALSMADWLNPTIAAADKYFGKREHGRNEKDKKISKFSCSR